MQTEQSELSDTVATLPPEERQYVSIGYAASLLSTTPAGVLQLLNRGIINADADLSGDVLLFKLSALQDARRRMKGEE